MQAGSRPAYSARSLQRVCVFVKVDRTGRVAAKTWLNLAWVCEHRRNHVQGPRKDVTEVGDLRSRLVRGREIRAPLIFRRFFA